MGSERHSYRLILIIALCVSLVESASSYLSEFVNPDYIAARQFDIRTRDAGASIIRWANEFAMQGPWSMFPTSHSLMISQATV